MTGVHPTDLSGAAGRTITRASIASWSTVRVRGDGRRRFWSFWKLPRKQQWKWS